jgi:hypothetical protein
VDHEPLHPTFYLTAIIDRISAEKLRRDGTRWMESAGVELRDGKLRAWNCENAMVV